VERMSFCFSSKIVRIIDPEPYNRGHAVMLAVEALRYRPEGCGFDGVIGIFNWHNPSGRTKALSSTQPLTEMSTRNICWVRRADKLIALCADCHEIWELQNPGAFRVCTGIALPFTVLNRIVDIISQAVKSRKKKTAVCYIYHVTEVTFCTSSDSYLKTLRTLSCFSVIISV
jgi:hypothetical protein